VTAVRLLPAEWGCCNLPPDSSPRDSRAALAVRALSKELGARAPLHRAPFRSSAAALSHAPARRKFFRRRDAQRSTIRRFAGEKFTRASNSARAGKTLRRPGALLYVPRRTVNEQAFSSTGCRNIRSSLTRDRRPAEQSCNVPLSGCARRKIWGAAAPHRSAGEKFAQLPRPSHSDGNRCGRRESRANGQKDSRTLAKIRALAPPANDRRFTSLGCRTQRRPARVAKMAWGYGTLQEIWQTFCSAWHWREHLPWSSLHFWVQAW
jgi:hypothetical protein